ncbi:MAG TPA: GFA family protein [Stellaceae bacterium]|nr:GFA family protein [Stellaceae bacterium]
MPIIIYSGRRQFQPGIQIVLIHQGGCLCGEVRYETRGEPRRVTICHCRFCQRATGAAYMVEPIFPLADFRITTGTPATFDQRSVGSGKLVHIHFCARCGTKLYLSFERFGDACGVYAGTFDDPNWFAIGPDNSRHVFIGVARHDTIIPPGIKAYAEHATLADGTATEPVTFDAPHAIGRGGR